MKLPCRRRDPNRNTTRILRFLTLCLPKILKLCRQIASKRRKKKIKRVIPANKCLVIDEYTQKTCARALISMYFLRKTNPGLIQKLSLQTQRPVKQIKLDAVSHHRMLVNCCSIYSYLLSALVNPSGISCAY